MKKKVIKEVEMVLNVAYVMEGDRLKNLLQKIEKTFAEVETRPHVKIIFK